MAPLGALTQAWTSAEASLPLGWQLRCRLGLWLFVGILLAGCNGSVAPSASPSPSQAESAAVASVGPSEAAAKIVGVWRGEHECEGIANALAEAGFDESVIIENIVGNGLVPGAESPEDVEDVAQACEKATPLEHSHEFTAEGEFFSYDQDGNEVDFGTYELVDGDTLTIGAPDRPGVTFDFIVDGDHLTLQPQLEANCLEFECMWAVMVAMPWSGMERVS